MNSYVLETPGARLSAHNPLRGSLVRLMRLCYSWRLTPFLLLLVAAPVLEQGNDRPSNLTVALVDTAVTLS